MNESILFNCDSETATQTATTALTRHQLSIVRSFDLRSALGSHLGCDCPHHGTDQCNCQFVVLLIYGQAAEPVVLTTHSRDDWTEARLVHDVNTIPNRQLVEAVMTALAEAALMLPDTAY